MALLFGPAIYRGWRSVSWAKAPGTIVQSQLKESVGGDDRADWRVFLNCRFFVDRHQIDGSRFTSTGEYYSATESEARQFQAAHRVGDSVDVFYNPDDPTNAVLQPGLDYRHWTLLSIIVVLLALGFAMLIGLVPVWINK